MRRVILFLLFSAVLSAETFPATWKKALWFDGKGTLEIDDQGITYVANNHKQRLHWGWLDIQYFDRVSRKEFVLLTYKDQRLLLGRDREYRFVITRGELSDALFGMISSHLNRPVTDRVQVAADHPK